jgi:hypothetical protein
MANRKQRRRREKEKRHDYDLVEIDAEGNETVLSASELKPANGAVKGPPAKRSGGSGGSAPARGRGRGPMQPPSWPRVLKRGALFAPIFLATVMLLGGGKMTLATALVQTLLLVAVFVPFSYFMDRVFWRAQQKRLAKSRGA